MRYFSWGTTKEARYDCDHSLKAENVSRATVNGTTGPQTMGLPVPKLWDYQSPNYGTTGPQTMGLPAPNPWDYRSPNYGTAGPQTMGLPVPKLCD